MYRLDLAINDLLHPSLCFLLNHDILSINHSAWISFNKISNKTSNIL